MIIHTRKKEYKKYCDGLKTGSLKAKNFKSTVQRHKFLGNIRKIESEERLKDLTPFKTNKLEYFFGIPGVYFLFNEDRLVYIGESSCIISRIQQHTFNKTFTSFKLIVIEDGTRRLKIEMEMIKKYAPILNIVHNPTVKNTSPIIKYIKNDNT